MIQDYNAARNMLGFVGQPMASIWQKKAKMELK
jgi:hypothetical protein